MRSTRQRKPTEKGAQYNEKRRAVPEKPAPAKRQRKQPPAPVAEPVQEVIAPDNIPEPEDDFPEVILDENDKIFKQLKYNRDRLADMTKAIIDKYPPGFLPDIFKGLIPLLVEKKVEPLKVNVSMADLKEGKYHTKSSNSDKNVASGVKTLLKSPELTQYNKDDLSDFIENHRQVFYTILKNGLEKKHSVATIKGYVVKLVRLLFIAYKNKKTTPIYTKYAILMHRLGGQQEAIDGENTLNENEEGRYIDWAYVMAEQVMRKERFDSTINKDTKNAYALNLDLLLVSLYSLTPPLRKEVMALQFKKQGADNKADYVYFKRDKTILDLNLNKKRHGEIDIPVSKELHDILRQSYDLYPRTHLFTDARKYPNLEKPLAISSVGNRLRKMFIRYGVNIGPSILRSSYVTYRFNMSNWRLTTNETDEMARLMRTSAKYILSSYRKNISDGVNVKQEGAAAGSVGIKRERVDDEPVADERTHVQRVVEDPYVKHNAYLVNKYRTDEEYKKKVLKQQQEYRDNKGPINIRRPKLIRLLKRSVAYRESIKKETLEKYNITEEDYM